MNNGNTLRIINIALYGTIYILLSLYLVPLYNPYPGIIAIVVALAVDLYFSHIRLRTAFRVIFSSGLLLAVYCLVTLFSQLSSDFESYNIFDTIPYVLMRDLTFAFITILLYYILDSMRVIRNSFTVYNISLLIFVTAAAFLFNLRSDISDSIYGSYAVYAGVLFLVLLLIMLRHVVYFTSLNRRSFDLKSRLSFGALFLVIMIVLFFTILQNEMNAKGQRNSGLFQDNLFKFDFSDFLELKDEIKLSEDRVLIMELNGIDPELDNSITDGWDRQIYLKRFALEEYVTDSGFKTALNSVDESSPPINITGYMWEIPKRFTFKGRNEVSQTLYMLNIDPTSTLGIDYMYKLAPIEKWDDSPFKSIYRSYSDIFTGNIDNIYYDNPDQTNFIKSLSPERKRLLTFTGGSELSAKIKKLTSELTAGYDSTFLKAVIIQEYLRNNFYYSLKPGLSGQVPPLENFLFNTKKGYCSYFAFAMTLMLRSEGIASRVSVGFAPDLKNRTLNFYDIRSMDGHAWVEVYFDDYGWITFDPTSPNPAPEDNFSTPRSNKEERDSLIEKILTNKERMTEVTDKFTGTINPVSKLFKSLNRTISGNGILIFGGIIIVLLIIITAVSKRFLIAALTARDPSLKAIYYYKEIIFRLGRMGIRLRESELKEEFAFRLKTEKNIDITEITSLYNRALFSGSKTGTREIRSAFKRAASGLKRSGLTNRLRYFFDITAVFRKLFPILILLVLPFALCKTDCRETLDEAIKKARTAINNDYFDKALSILNKAEADYPESYIPDYEKGKLYFDNELYSSALTEFKQCRAKGLKTDLLYIYLASSYAKKGDDKNTLAVYLEALSENGDNPDLYDNIGWAYYKLHRYKEGINILEKGLGKYPEKPELEMTLGTLYSSMWDYDKSKIYYLRAIQHSMRSKDSEFRAIAYYNLALLEEAFLYYKNAFNSAEASLSMRERSSGRMEIAFLYMKALKNRDAYREIKTSSSLKPFTLFPESSLSYLYVNSGHEDKGVKISINLLQNRDYSWLQYFGSNIDSFKLDIYKNLTYGYKYMSSSVKYAGNKNYFSFIKDWGLGIIYRMKSLYYNIKMTNLSLKLSEEKITGGNSIEGLYQLYDGYELISPSKAHKSVRLAENIEAEINPRKKRITAILKALTEPMPFFYKRKKAEDNFALCRSLDEEWEKYLKVELLSKTAMFAPADIKIEILKYLAKEAPFLIISKNLRLPVNLTFADNFSGGERKQLAGEIFRRGFEESYDGVEAPTLILHKKGGSKIGVTLTGDGIIKEFEITYKSVDDFGSNLYDNVFREKF